VNTATDKYRNYQETFDFSDRTGSGTRPATAGVTGMRDAGTPQGVRHEILSVGPSCADNTLHKPEVLIIAVIGGITEARNIQRWPYTHWISVAHPRRR
jgi:hypothetical protein